MKVWVGFGSEHSYDLVLLGQFEDATKAQRVKEQIDAIAERASDDMQPGWGADTYWSDALRDLLTELSAYDLSAADVEGFAYEHTVQLSGRSIRVWTDDGEVQGFIKLIIGQGGKVEVFSRHHWNEDGTPKPKPPDN